MAYTVDDITELSHYHLVLAEPDDKSADRNLSQLVDEIQNLASRPSGKRRPGSFATGAGARWTPS